MKSQRLAQLSLIGCLLLSTSGCIIHVGGHNDGSSNSHGDISSVLGDLEVDANSDVSDVSTVNGNITINDNVQASELDTVNGNISIAQNVRINSASTVNGDIDAESQLVVSNGLSTVNGDITLATGAEVGSDISTVNGAISLRNAQVKGEVETKNGNISLRDATRIDGDIVFLERDEKRWFSGELPTLRIDASSEVQGKIKLYRQVVLEIENPDLLARVERLYQKK